MLRQKAVILGELIENKNTPPNKKSGVRTNILFLLIKT
jgi:hypothetical protein